MPSMVVTLAPLACPTSTVHDLTARPSICTTQAPHWLVSQPTWVPVRFRFSRRRWTRRVLSSISAETAVPLIFNSTLDIPQLPAFLFQRLCPNQRLRPQGLAVLAKATEAVANLPLD